MYPRIEVRLTSWQRQRLQRICDQPPTPRMGKRAVCLLPSADGVSTRLIAQATELAPDILVIDDGLGVNNLSLSGADAALFQIVGSVLYLKAGTVLDYQTNPGLEVTVAVDDTTVGGTPDSTATLTIAVTRA